MWLVFGFASQVFGGEMEPTPQYLYKVLSAEDWKASHAQTQLQLPSADSDFIHFSRVDQLERILTKYWNDSPEYYVLKIDVSQLSGELVFEVNPGGTAKYYHLYNGSIPLHAVVESQKLPR